MQIINHSTWNIKIPLRFQFSQSNNRTSQSNSLVLKLVTKEGISGFGETCPRLYVTGEDIDSVQKDIATIMPKLQQLSLNSLEAIQNLVTNQLPHTIGLASICAIELALLDAWSKTHQLSLFTALKGQQKTIKYSGIIPLLKPKYLELVFQQLKHFQFEQVKLKVDAKLEENIQKIKLIRSALGAATQIRLDANTSWTAADAQRLIPAYLDVGVNSFEQLFQKGQEALLKPVMKTFGKEAKIMADESLTSFDSAQFLLENKLCNALNIKISKTGGLFNALKIKNYADQHGIPCQLGAHFGETSILTRAGLLFASMTDSLSATEGGFGTFLLQEAICKKPIQFDQNGCFPIGIGLHLPLEIHEDVLLKYEAQKNVVTGFNQ